MPELPEVENVKLSLEGLGAQGQVFAKVELRRKDLRTRMQPEMAKKLAGQTVREIRRRAKFLLFETDEYVVLSHLGMTGSWRQIKEEEYEKHDHVVFHFKSGLTLVFNDPRRFGVLEILRKPANSKWLNHLGREPLAEDFSAEYLFSESRRIKAPVKNFIMDQKRVVGVGNIYASEALFRAAIKPTRQAGKITKAEAVRLVKAIKTVLLEAIAAGGSTIRDYKNGNGESGQFQQRFAVYGRAGEKCVRCGGTVKSKFLAGRNTYWCPSCQS
jgi:formamidopyrimidine-DNA glycosylase